VTLFSLDDLADAASIVGRHVPRTPTYHWPLLDEAVGAAVAVKHENLTPAGAFKVRGGLVLVDHLVRAPSQPAGIVSATRGNHGISLAFAGRAHALAVVIVVPEGNSVEKNATMQALGAEVVIAGQSFDEARGTAAALATERGLMAIPPFHPKLVLGVATYARELFDDAGPLDAVYVPIGMGSGICGLITVRDLLGLPTQIIGVGAEGAPAQRDSFAAGRAMPSAPARTFVDGVATATPDEQATAIICAGAERVITVPDEATAEAIRLIWRTTHHLAEPAGAIALAGLMAERRRWQGKRVAFVLCGSNMDTAMASTVLAGGTPSV
jgi:threonine dehydratase